MPHAFAGTFADHGIAVHADESRTAAVCIRRDGACRFVIAARGYVLVVDPVTGESRQLFFSNGIKEYPFASYSDRNGMYYTGAGRQFMMLDPFSATFLHVEEPAPPQETAVGFSFAEDDHGHLYATTYPGCRLLRFDPVRRESIDLGPMDPQEMYAFHIAAGKDGWVYAGIGTERGNIAAVHPATGRVRSLVPESERVRGTGYVHLGQDGCVYGRYPASTDAGPWYRLEGGEAFAVPGEAVPQEDYSGAGFSKVHRAFPPPWTLIRFSLQDKELVIRNGIDGAESTIELSYSSAGADLSPLVACEGNIYGTSNHPLHMFRYNPAENVLTDYGGKLIERGGGGNICAFAIQERKMVGAAYAGGHLHLFDMQQPFSSAAGKLRNPQLVAVHGEVHRPRCALAHPDKEHVIYGGFAGYGAVGGGLGIYNVVTGEDSILTNDQLLKHHSTLCLAALTGGDLLGGTSIESPGGGHPKEREGRLYRLDWPGRRIVYSTVPVQGARGIVMMVVDKRGLVHGFTDHMKYFVYNEAEREVLHVADLSAYGINVRGGLTQDADGTIYGAFSNILFTVDTGSFTVIPLAKPPLPVTSGLAVSNGRLYYAAGSRLMSLKISEPT